jgi:hypothetical protein
MLISELDEEGRLKFHGLYSADGRLDPNDRDFPRRNLGARYNLGSGRDDRRRSNRGIDRLQSVQIPTEQIAGSSGFQNSALLPSPDFRRDKCSTEHLRPDPNRHSSADTLRGCGPASDATSSIRRITVGRGFRICRAPSRHDLPGTV